MKDDNAADLHWAISALPLGASNDWNVMMKNLQEQAPDVADQLHTTCCMPGSDE